MTETSGPDKATPVRRKVLHSVEVHIDHHDHLMTDHVIPQHSTDSSVKVLGEQLYKYTCVCVSHFFKNSNISVTHLQLQQQQQLQ